MRTLPEQTSARGGVMLPIWQAEALWLNFRNNGPHPGLPFPVAVKVAAGKVNAVTGEEWRVGLHRDPQDYMVSPDQPWLDGYAVEKGIIRQFVAMPLGDGYSAEEQLTGGAEWGGLQISVTPLKSSVWNARRRDWERAEEQRLRRQTENPIRCYAMPTPMAMAAGGRMRQAIYVDPFKLEDWEVDATDRVFVTLIHAKDWSRVTGEVAPSEPPTAKQYSAAGFPWYEHYGIDHEALSGGRKLTSIKPLGALFKRFTGSVLSNSKDVKIDSPIAVGPGADSERPVNTKWDD